MFTPSPFLFYLSVVYIFILLIVSIIICCSRRTFFSGTKNVLLLLFILALIIRIIPVLFFPFASGFDIDSFLWAGNRILTGHDIYWDLIVRERFSFLPTYGMFSALFILLEYITKIPAFIWMKLVIIVFDSAIPVLLYLMKQNTRMSLLYAFSPVPVIIGAYLGQFEAIVLFYLLLSFYFYTKRKYSISYLLLGISFCFKPWPLLFLPLMLIKSRTFKPSLSFLTGPVLVLLSYKLMIPGADLLMMGRIITSYESVIGWFGPSIIVYHLAQIVNKHRLIPISGLLSKAATIIILIKLTLMLKKESLFEGAKLLILAVYIFSFGLSIHYFLWILPFALLTKDKWAPYFLAFAGFYFSVQGTFHLLTYRFTPPDIPRIWQDGMSFLLWCFFVYWGLSVFKRIKKLRARS